MGDSVCNWSMADEEGFEPSYGFSHNTLSKRAPSATRPPFQTKTKIFLIAFLKIALQFLRRQLKTLGTRR